MVTVAHIELESFPERDFAVLFAVPREFLLNVVPRGGNFAVQHLRRGENIGQQTVDRREVERGIASDRVHRDSAIFR